MTRWTMACTATALIVWGAGCPPAGECQTNADCPAGQICATGNVCRDATDPIPGRDSGPRDAALADHALADQPLEDTQGQDLSARDSATGVDSGSSDSGSSDGGNPQQVTVFTSCNGPRALALNPAQDELYVACEEDDTIKVYQPVTGEEQRELTSLPSPCEPRSLHLLESIAQLWVACGDSSSQKVYNTNPQTGAANEAGFGYGGLGRSARFASCSDRLVWADAGGGTYHLRQIGSGTTSSLVADGTGLNLGNGVAMVDTGASFFTNYNTANGDLTRRDRNNGVITNFIAPSINNQLIAYSPATGLLIISSNSAYSRLSACCGEAFGPAQNFGLGADVQALVMRPDGNFAFLGRYSSTSTTSTIDMISMDPAQTSPTA
ncbi:MAG: hypothetical protein JXR83_10800, partial [Deltaproteobacteria bacterium]|nr:hypothetical protein [Deltaproteobacteria bacterium]